MYLFMNYERQGPQKQLGQIFYVKEEYHWSKKGARTIEEEKRVIYNSEA